MTYAIHEHHDIQIVQVNRLLDESDNKQILSAIKDRIKKGLNDLIVDLTEVDFMTSVGLNFLISTRLATKETGGYLAIANSNEQVIKLLEITKLKQMFNLTQTVEEALQHLESNN